MSAATATLLRWARAAWFLYPPNRTLVFLLLPLQGEDGSGTVEWSRGREETCGCEPRAEAYMGGARALMLRCCNGRMVVGRQFPRTRCSLCCGATVCLPDLDCERIE
jgi:hypothetical protein